MSFKVKPLHATDSYKLGHRPAYPNLTEEVYSNWTPRSVSHLNVPEQYKTNEIIWAGGQASVTDMIELWNEEFFQKDVEAIIVEYSRRIGPFVGPNEYPMDHIRDLHAVGYLPLEIKTLPEGSRVPVGVPVLTIRNTDKRFAWLTNYLESGLSSESWQFPTSATIADYYRKIITHWADITGGNKDFIDFQAHDFSYRGMGGAISAAKSGSGHLLSFKGTDTLVAVDYLEYHYGARDSFVGASVPAMEHSIQCAFANDYNYIKRTVSEIYPNGIVSVVCDGYDYWNVLTEIVPALKEEILARGPDALGMSKVVFRPDSGDPVRIIAGYTYNEKSDPFTDRTKYEVHKATDGFYYANKDWDINEYGDCRLYPNATPLTEAEVKGSVHVLWDIFGGTINAKGFKTVLQRVGLIYGDSITLTRADEILRRLADKGFASDNVVFGVGSYTYQYNTRDTLGQAMKATNVVIDSVDTSIWKDPKTDNGTKKSAKGLLCVREVDGVLTRFNNVSRKEEQTGLLTTLYKDGEFKKFEVLDDIRARLAAYYL